MTVVNRVVWAVCHMSPYERLQYTQVMLVTTVLQALNAAVSLSSRPSGGCPRQHARHPGPLARTPSPVRPQWRGGRRASACAGRYAE
eukprot:13897942-Alexandrium_andersonii.AAC.1